MAHRLTTLTAVLFLAGIPGLGQIIIPGVGYPGGGYGYPGGRRGYPQQYPNSQSPSEPTNTSMVGILRKIEDKDVIIEGDDRAITTIAVTSSTKLRDTTGKSTNMGDFQPGDHVRIETKQEHNNANLAYRALSMTMIREGTMDEHAAASQAEDDPTHPITKPSGNSSSASASSGDLNRPVLHRASGADSSSNSSNESDDDNDPDRPHLRRAPSSGGDSTSSSSTASNGSSSSSSSSDDDDPDRPRLRRAPSSADSTPVQNPNSSATVAAPRPASTSSSSSSASSSSSGDADDAPPVLRRAPTSGSGSSSNDSTTTVADARPSIHANDNNGVTQLPSAPVVGPAEQPVSNSGGLRVPNRLPSSGDDVIDQARQAGFSYSETLPNYIVKQYTTRYETQAARGGHTSWQALDEVTADVLEVNGVEQYKNIMVNGHTPREDVTKTGSWSSGEFSSLLLDILSPATNADFHGRRSTTIANRAAYRYDLEVQQPNSHWHIESEGQTYMPGYTGTVWIDKQTYRVLRIELQAERMPSGFPLDTVESAVDYDFVQIGDGKYLLPVHSESLSCGRGTSDCSRNVIEFRNYRKFSADTSITFDTNN